MENQHTRSATTLQICRFISISSRPVLVWLLQRSQLVEPDRMLLYLPHGLYVLTVSTCIKTRTHQTHATAEWLAKQVGPSRCRDLSRPRKDPTRSTTVSFKTIFHAHGSILLWWLGFSLSSSCRREHLCTMVPKPY